MSLETTPCLGGSCELETEDENKNQKTKPTAEDGASYRNKHQHFIHHIFDVFFLKYGKLVAR